MLAFDTTFLVDYLDGDDEAGEYLAEIQQRVFFAPTLALFEVYRGAGRSAGPEGIETVAESLDWVEPLPLTNAAALEAAEIEEELLDAGRPVNLGDVLIAGICRNNGATLVTRDEDFQEVKDLDVETY